MAFAFRVRGENQRFLLAPAVQVGIFYFIFGWGDSGEQRSAGCAEHPSAPGVARGDSRAASATSPPLAASPGSPPELWGSLGGTLTCPGDARHFFPTSPVAGLQQGWSGPDAVRRMEWGCACVAKFGVVVKGVCGVL